MKSWTRALVAGGLLALAGAGAQAQEIDWRLEQRFRLFEGAGASAAKVEALLAEMKRPAGAAGPADLVRHYDQLLAVLSGPGAEDLRTANWDPARRRYRDGYLGLRPYQVSVRLTGAAAEQLCRWRTDGGETGGETLPAAPCGEWRTLTVKGVVEDGRRRGRATVTAEPEGGAPVSLPIVVEDELVAALGDSFIAGEGNPDVPAVFSQPASGLTDHPRWPNSSRLAVQPARFWDTPCHRSLLSFPVLTALYMAAQDEKRAVTLVHLGCSGAEAGDGIYARQKDLPGDGRNERETQVQQLQALLGDGAAGLKIDRLLLSLGGNDIGFASVVQTLALPTRDYRLPFGAQLVGLFGGAVCPYTDEWRPLSKLCPAWRPSAQERLQGLPAEYGKARAAIADLPVAAGRIVQTQYPDILRYRDGQGALRFCSTALNDRDLAYLSGEELAREAAYAQAYPGRVRMGFESLQGVVPWFARLQRPYFFQFQYYPEADAPDGCDDTAEGSDSEVCQAYWVWRRLNDEVAQNRDRFGWQVVRGHVAESAGHGWCVYPADETLGLPLSTQAGGGWTWTPAGPEAFKPYRQDLGRWFRTPNDSARAQWHGRERFHQGTVHPTFRAHVAYAEAVLNEAIYAPGSP